MRKAALSISSVFLCGLLIYNSLGYFMVLSVMRISIRQQKWAQISAIPNHQLTKFTFEKNRPNSRLIIINKREIRVDGMLYDIARMTDDGKTITFHGLYDNKEEKVIAKTRLFHSMTQPVPAKNTTRLIIEKIIKIAVIKSQFTLFTPDYFQLFTFYMPTTYSGPAISILIPPPQNFS